MSDEKDSGTHDEGGEDPLDRELRALFKSVQDEPVSDELKRLARRLEARLQNRGTD